MGKEGNLANSEWTFSAEITNSQEYQFLKMVIAETNEMVITEENLSRIGLIDFLIDCLSARLKAFRDIKKPGKKGKGDST